MNETIELPKKSGEYKFLLIEFEGRHYLRFGSIDSYHDQILERFKKETKAAVKQCGGGRALIDHERKHIKFYGESKIFGPFDKNILAQVIKYINYRIEIG